MEETFWDDSFFVGEEEDHNKEEDNEEEEEEDTTYDGFFDEEDVPALVQPRARARVALRLGRDARRTQSKCGLRHRATDFTLGANRRRFGNRPRVSRHREITGRADVFPSVFERVDALARARSDTRNESGERGCDWSGRERGGGVVGGVEGRGTDKDGCECENVVHRLGSHRGGSIPVLFL